MTSKKAMPGALSAKNSHDNRDEPKCKRYPVVAIGASAGGLEAYREFFHALPADPEMAFILIQHFDGQQESHLAEILSTETSVPIEEIRSGERIRPNRVYIAPARMVPAISGGEFTLNSQASEPGQHLPINFLMRSLADDETDCAIGIILSGTGCDGTLGLASIKAEGGITFAQEPATAEYDAMPRSAIDSGCVDFVMTPAEIAQELLRIQRHPYLEYIESATEPEHRTAENVQAHHSPDDADLSIIVEQLQKVTNVNFRDYKPSTLCRRALRRAAILRLNSLGDYAKFLIEHPEESVRLYDDVLIPVTSFFRDPDVFETLKLQIFPGLIKKIGEKGDIRIWVAGCSTGEEAYTLAILLQECLGDRIADYRVQIFGTDLNEKAIQRARTGVYGETIAQQVGPNRLRRFFVKTDLGYRIEKSVREMCVFARHNLASDPPFSQINLVTCRNLLIYLQPVLQRRIIPMLHYALQPSGFLLLGGSESVAGFPELFSLIDKKNKIYAKKQASSRLHFDFIQTYYPATLSQSLSTRPHEHGRAESEALMAADRLVLENHAPVGVVINAALEVIQFRGRPAPYLEPTSGKPTLNVLKLARNGLSVELRTLIGKARKQWRMTRKDGVPFDDRGHQRVLNISVSPLGEKDSQDKAFLLILFEDATPRWVSQDGSPSGSREKEIFENLELKRVQRELADAQSSLRAAIESEDSLKEEFQSANEEILSANEELQSTNEELETSKEELQSANEELNTLNGELRQKNTELQELSSDISNLLHSTRIPAVMLDRSLRIRRVTPMADRLLKVVPSDIGRQIADIRLNIDVPDLESMIASVLETLLPIEREVRDIGGRWHNLSVLPYRTQDDRIDGVVLALQDIDAIQSANEQLKRSAEFFRAVMDTVIEPLLVLGAELRVIAANQPFLNAFKVSLEETLNHSFYRLANGAWNTAELRSKLEGILSDGQMVRGFTLERDFEHIGLRTMLVNAHMLASSPSVGPAILVAIEDITDRKRAEREMARLAAIVESSDDAIVGKNLEGIIETWNRGAERIFGYSPEEAIGQPVTMLIPLDRIDEEPAILERIRRGEHVDHFESIRRCKNGSLLHVSLTISPIIDRQGRIVGASKIVRDITSRKQSETALMKSEKLAAAGRLAAILAHEINNPLQAVVNLISLLGQSRNLDEQEQSYIKLSSEELARLTHLTRQSLSFYRESAAPQSVNIEEAVEELLDLYSHRLVAKSISVRKEYSDETVVRSYRGEVRQVLTALLLNAIEAIPDTGTISIRIRKTFRWSDSVKHGIRIVIADSGAGVSRENADRIFEPFFTTKGEQGTGLGLWVANGIISRLGGIIQMRSSRDPQRRGTCFSIFLPADVEESLPPANVSF
jgi:two-component system CheB/CheR fusion protein